jgi:hypothetical protein
MKCEEAAEFVSAICDGERIPGSAAEHVGRCETCRCRLKEFVEIGAELRLMASLESSEELEVPHWGKERRVRSNWWRQGGESMRIPRFVFALLLVVVVGLSSSLVIGSVRSHTLGKVLMLTAKPANGHTLPCTLSLRDKAGSCRFVQMEGTAGGRGIYKFRIVSDDGENIQLGIRSARVYRYVSNDDIDSLPETPYWFRAGETLRINVPEAGELAINGELWDHYPSPGEVWDRMQSLANCR